MTPEEFVKELQSMELSDENRVNFYREFDSDSREPIVKSRNLLLYLKKMRTLNPKILLVGEAPGYKGCKLTGIPFTSEYQIKDEEFFKDGGFEVLHYDNPERENSAGVIWNVIGNAKQIPLMWNIFPFHPSTNDGRNGKPKGKDIETGKQILEKLLSMFNIERVYCIGRKSEHALKGCHCGYIRHPSHGGSKECKEQLEKILH